MELVLNYNKTKESLHYLLFNVELKKTVQHSEKMLQYGPHKITSVHNLFPPDCDVRI
jgi:hypothetical protein